MATDTVQGFSNVRRKRFWQRGFLASQSAYVLVALVVLVVVMALLSPNFLTPGNIANITRNFSFIAIATLGMTLVIITGGIDLSVGSVLGFVGALAAVMIVQWNMNFVVAAILCLAVGAAIGAAQGFWIAYYRIPSFIVTLAGMLVFKGLTLWLLAGQSVGPFPQAFQRIASGFVPDFLGGTDINLFSLVIGVAVACLLVYLALRARRQEQKRGIESEPLTAFTIKNALIFAALAYMSWLMASFRGLPNVFIVMALLIAVYSFVANRTTVGRRIYATGGNEKAAKLSGIRTERLVFLTFANMGMLAALAGLVFAARLNTATPKAGLGFELDVIAAVFIGGASMSGGVGTIVGAVIGAFIMGVMNNGMSILGIGIDYQQVIKGLVLLAAVIFDVYNKNRS